MASDWNFDKVKTLLWPWSGRRIPQTDKFCRVCNGLQTMPSQEIGHDGSRVLFSVTTALLKGSAARCIVCEAFYLALTKYPWPSDRPSHRTLQPQSNEKNEIVVSTNGTTTLKMVVVSNFSPDIASSPLYMYTSGCRKTQISACAKIANVQQVIDYHGRISLLFTLSALISVPKSLLDGYMNGSESARMSTNRATIQYIRRSQVA